MFQKISHTIYPPDKPTIVWDGTCGFCKFWVTRWKDKTGSSVDYTPYQDVAEHYKDVPLKEFKKASRLIEPNGNIYSGPDSAYRCYDHTGKHYPFHKWYRHYSFFRTLSDHGYNWIAKNRSFMFKVTHLFFGKNPTSLKPYWLFYLLTLILILCLIF